MANEKITQLNELTAPASDDVLPIVDVSANETKKVQVGNLRPYLVYVVRLSQSGTNAPVPHVLENTLGITPTWTRDGIGSYAVDLGDLFDGSKLWVMSVGIANNDDFRSVQLLADSQESGTQFFFQCVRLDTGAAVELHTAASAPRCYIEIRLYP